MSKFSEILTQKNQVNVYSPGANTCKSGTCSSSTKVPACNNCDWNYANQTCAVGCPSQRLCSGLDTTVCPSFNGAFVGATWNTSAIGACPSTPQVKCQYDANLFNIQSVNDYRAQFCSNNSCTGNSNFNSILMPSFCFQDTTVCTGNLTECPEIMNSGQAGALCKNWAVNNPTSFSDAAGGFCSDPSNSMCGCVNRAANPVYNYIKPNLDVSIPDSCWFLSCTDPNFDLIPPGLSNPGCNRTTMCANINNIIKTVPTNLTREQLLAQINCDNLANTIPINMDPTMATSGSWFWIILIIIIVLLIIIIAFAVFSR